MSASPFEPRSLAWVGLVALLGLGQPACTPVDGAEGPAGPQGPAGPPGSAGVNGEPGPAGQYTVGAGLLLDGGAISADTSLLQSRITGTCGTGLAMKSVDATGGVGCQTVTDPRLGNPNIPDGSGGGSSSVTCFLGEVMLFAGNFAPSGTYVADGRLLPISGNTALFSLLGTLYGGNGTSNFALPNLQALAPAGVSYVICAVGTFPAHS